jgi:hypothetical protein
MSAASLHGTLTHSSVQKTTRSIRSEEFWIVSTRGYLWLELSRDRIMLKEM